MSTSSSTDQSPTDDELRLQVMAGVPEVSLVFQAIVDLQRGVVAGYEVLSRFAGPLMATPDRWVAAATRMGRGRELETAIWKAAFEASKRLPANTFMSINATPDFLASSECSDLVHTRESLEGIVIEVTEHEAITDYDRLSASLSRYRSLGASVAVDDAGAGYASMTHVLALRPEFIKLDRGIVTDCDHDPAKAALVEMVGSFAGRIDSWMIAEGVEREGELATLSRMGVPLGQGYYLARPDATWSAPRSSVSDHLQERARLRTQHSTVEAFIEAVASVSTQEDALRRFAADPHIDIVVVLDEWRRPFCLARRDGPGMRLCPAVMRVLAYTDVHDAVLRAMTRDVGTRFDPIACTHGDGSLMGLIRIEHLVEHLAKRDEPGNGNKTR